MATEIIPQGAAGASDTPHTHPVTTAELFERLDEQARRWLSLIESTLETHRNAAHIHPDPVQPLPEWAVQRLHDGGRIESGAAEYWLHRSMLREAFKLASGEGSNTRYEIWDPRPNSRFVRLEIRSESLQEARERLDLLKVRFPSAHIVQVDVRHTGGGASDPALYDTLVGKLWHAGTSYPSDGHEIFEIQDETGRTVSIEAQVLLQHPMFERLSFEAQEAVRLSARKPARKAELRAEAKAHEEGGS